MARVRVARVRVSAIVCVAPACVEWSARGASSMWVQVWVVAGATRVRVQLASPASRLVRAAGRRERPLNETVMKEPGTFAHDFGILRNIDREKNRACGAARKCKWLGNGELGGGFMSFHGTKRQNVK